MADPLPEGLSARLAEARIEDMTVLLRPVLASTAGEGAAPSAAAGIATEAPMAASGHGANTLTIFL